MTFPLWVQVKNQTRTIAIPGTLVLCSIAPLHLSWQPLKSHMKPKFRLETRFYVGNGNVRGSENVKWKIAPLTVRHDVHPRHSRGDARGAKHHGVEPIVLHPGNGFIRFRRWGIYRGNGVWDVWLVYDWFMIGLWLDDGEWLGMVGYGANPCNIM